MLHNVPLFVSAQPLGVLSTPIQDNRMSMDSIMRKRWMKKSNNTATKGVPRNRRRSGRISSGNRSENESGLLDGSADALHLHTVPRKDCRVNSVRLAVFNMSWDLSIGSC